MNEGHIFLHVLAQKPEAQGCVWVRKDKSGVFPTSSQEALPAKKPETPGRKTSGGDPPDTLFTPSHVEGSSWGVLLSGLDAQKPEKNEKDSKKEGTGFGGEKQKKGQTVWPAPFLSSREKLSP